MLEVVTPDLSPLYRQELRDMFRLRARVFGDRLGWQVEVRDGEERDEFDDQEPVYLLALDDERRVIGASRLLPTSRPHMLGEVFSVLLEDRSPLCDPRVLEWSKLAIDCSAGKSGGLASVRRLTRAFFCGVAEYSLLNGFHDVVTVYDARILRLLPRIGCAAVWQSRPYRIGEQPAYAARFEVTAFLLERLRNACGLSGTVFRQMQTEEPSKAA